MDSSLYRALERDIRTTMTLFKQHLAALPRYAPANPEGARHFANENPLGPSPRALAAIRDAAASVHRYPDASAGELKEALADRFGVSPRHVLCTNGGDELLALVCAAFLSPGEEAIISEESFVTFSIRCRASGAQVKCVPTVGYRHDLLAMARAITERTRLIFVCNPNNPTGTICTRKEVLSFLNSVPRETLVVFDEAYAEFVTAPDFPDLPAELVSGRPGFLLLRTLAKAHGLAGLRIGCALGAPDVIDYIDKLRPVFSVNAIALAAAVAALGDEEHVRATVAHAVRWRERFESAFRSFGLDPISSQANFVTVRVGDEPSFVDHLMLDGCVVTGLGAWGLPGYARMSFGTDNENERLLASVGRWSTRSGAVAATRRVEGEQFA